MLLELGIKFNDFDWWRRAMWSDLRGYLMLLYAEQRENAAREAGRQPGRGEHKFGQPPDLRLVPREGEGPRT